MRKLILRGKLRRKGDENQALVGLRRWQHVHYSAFGARAKQTDSGLKCGLFNTYFKHL
jgi:hypothetical protein